MIMRKIFAAILCLSLVAGCGGGGDTIPIGGGNQGGDGPLIVGDTDQSGVNYRSSSETLDFTQTTVVGDSTFYEIAINLDEAGGNDLTFTLVKWTDFQVVTVKGTSDMNIPFSGSDIEIIELEYFIPGATFLLTGASINTTTTGNYTTAIEALAGYTYQGEISILTEQSLWNDKVYIPFRSLLYEGWIGVNIEADVNNEISGIGINTIAYRGL